jgi:hypothetical protein
MIFYGTSSDNERRETKLVTMKSLWTRRCSCKQYLTSALRICLTYNGVAGSETTATLLSGMFNYILRNRRCYDLLGAELRGAIEKESDLMIDNLGKLTYRCMYRRSFENISTCAGRLASNGPKRWFNDCWTFCTRWSKL